MIRSIELWTVKKLQEYYERIHFPEYQREPNVWGHDAKQRLIDSMMRQFDIAPLYFYKNENGIIDCVDGRQRVGAIMSFLGENENDPNNGFQFKILNELYKDEDNPFEDVDGLSFFRISQKAGKKKGGTAADFKKKLFNYQLTVVLLSDSQEYGEFNLQFARLNLGVIINSGEKLNAMVGDLRDICFGDEGLGEHTFLKVVSIPERRFGRQQTAAQILAQVFSLENNLGYTRTRHFDLQRLFKEYTEMSPEEYELVKKIEDLLSFLQTARKFFKVIRSRAFLVSIVLLADLIGVNTKDEATLLGKFTREFLDRLRWQIRKGLDVDQEYRYLVDFNRHVTQASVEKPAVTARVEVLEEEFNRWKDKGVLRGDKEFEENNGESASEACAKALSNS